MKKLSEQTLKYLQTIRSLNADLYEKMIEKLALTNEDILEKEMDIPEQKREVYSTHLNQTEKKQNIEPTHTEKKKTINENIESHKKVQGSVDEDWDESSHSKYDSEDELKGSEEKPEFARYFLVDYENVNREGMNGITKLTEADCVKIYYSEAAQTLTFGLHRRINESKAHFDYIKIRIPIKNAVDVQIVSDLQNLIKEHKDAEYVIVSKDTDYDEIIKNYGVSP